VGTVRVKDWDGHETVGTVRVKEGNPWGTISVNNAPWMGSSTIRIAHDDVQAALSEGAVQVAASAEEKESPQWMAAFREPEEWELSILALEKGEWIPEMDKNADAFRKYKKERKQVGNLFAPAPSRKRANATVLTAKPSSAVEGDDEDVETPRGDGEDEPEEVTTPRGSPAMNHLLGKKRASGKKEKKKDKRELKGMEKALEKMQ